MTYTSSDRVLRRLAGALVASVVASAGCGGSDDAGMDDTSIPPDDAQSDGGDADAGEVTDTDAGQDAGPDTADAPEDDGEGEVLDDGVDDTDLDGADADVVVPPPEDVLAVDMAVEPTGETALVTTLDGFVVRVDLTTMQLTAVLASGLMSPVGVAVETGGESALVVERDAGRLVRLDLETGDVTALASGLDYPQGVAIAPGGGAALITEGTGLNRVSLADGAHTVVSAVVQYGRDVVVEPGGASALVLEPGQVTRVALDTGAATPVATEATVGQGTFRGALALSTDGGTALVNTEIGCLVTIDLESEASARVGCLFENDQMALALEPGGRWAVLGTDGQLMRVNLAPDISRMIESNTGMEWLALESGGASVLVLSSAPGVEDPRLQRLTLSGGGLEPVATLAGFLGASGVAVEGGGASALVLGQGIVDDGGVTALLRVDVTTGAVTELTRSLDQCSGSGLAIAESGAAALIPCSPRLYRVDLATGGVTVVATGLDYGAVEVAEDGSWAVFSTMSGRELWRMELPSGTPERIGRNLFGSSPPGTGCTDVAIEAGGGSALVTQTGLYGGPYALTGRVVRVDLATGAVTVLVAGGLDAPGTFSCGTVGIAAEPGGASALVAEYHHGIARVGLPVP